MEYLPGLASKVSTVRDLVDVRSLPLSFLKNILLQIICILVTLQAALPNFAHNDLKLDNIMLRYSDGSDIEYNDFIVSAPLIDVVIIDVETATWDERKEVENLAKVPHHVLQDFGLCIETWSSWTDLHLVFMEILFYGNRKPWRAQVQAFFGDIIKPQVLKSHQEGNTLFVSPRNRLNEKGRKVINFLMENGDCFSLKKLLSHSFLNK
jgi:serine/threonine protein kinase